MAGPARLAAVPEEGPNGFTAVYPPHNLFRDSIRSVAVSGPQIRSTPFPHSRSSHNESSHSSDSGASSSYPSNNTGSSPCLASAAATQFSAQELTRIARRMVTDGYIQRMVQAFKYGGGPDRALEAWFFELDVDWVLQIQDDHGLRRQLQDKSTPSLQELVERWIRALTVIVVSITELVFTVDETPAVARFCKASISAMLVLIDAIAIIDVHKVEKLQAVLHMYVCIFGASYDMSTMRLSSLESRSIFNEIGGSLDREGNRLSKAIHSTMKEVRALIEDDDWWAIDIPQGTGDVHRNTRLMVDCIMSMVKARGWVLKSAWSHDTENLSGMIDDSIHYLKDLLLRKSELCSDPSLRYLFLLNNSYLVAQLFEFELRRSGKSSVELTPDCEKYMDSYLDVSWGHVMSHIRETLFMDKCLDVSCRTMFFCILERGSHGSRQHRKNASSLAKFELAFQKTYQAQKLWKVPNPRLRDALRRAITERVISGYHDYLKEHPELAEHVSRGRNSPDVLEEMLGELFEG